QEHMCNSYATLLPAESTPSAEVFQMARRGQFDEALRVLERSPQLWKEVESDGGHSLLHWAALAGNVPFISHAVAAGLEVDRCSENGQTPLMWAMTKGHVDACKRLLEVNANPHAKDSFGTVPFVLALQHQRHAAMLLFLASFPCDELLV
ncbi:unnamed protein product, partial [Polarella glacialis]